MSRRAQDDVSSSQTSPGSNMKVGPAPSHRLLQSACLFHEAAPPLPGPSHCQPLTWADVTSPLAPPLPSPLNPGWSGCHGNVARPQAFASGDWPLPGCLSKGRSYGPEQCVCVCCGTSSAPLWRRDAAGRQMCNSCSSRVNGEDTPLLKPRRRAVVSQKKFCRCENCETETSTLWRRNSAGQRLCNACGLYYKLHQVDRPLSLKKDWIQTRNRKVTNRKQSRKRASQSESKVFRLATPTENCFF